MYYFLLLYFITYFISILCQKKKLRETQFRGTLYTVCGNDHKEQTVAIQAVMNTLNTLRNGRHRGDITYFI